MAASKFSIRALLLLAFPLWAQNIPREKLAEILGFENGVAGEHPAGWGGMRGDIKVDDQVFHSGKLSARIERTDQS